MRAFSRVALLLAAMLPSSMSAAEPAIEIGSRRELFVDDYLIDRLAGVEFRLHEPVKTPRPKSPLPEQHMMTVIKDGELYRAWYRGFDPAYKGETHTGHPGETVCYAESRDGHEWTFPQLRLHEIGGTRDNNVILANQPPFLTNFMPFLDTRPGVDPAERYKALAGYPGAGDKRGLDEPGHGLFAFTSPDGIAWKQGAEAIRFRPEWRHAFDSPNVAFWSSAENRYVCYFRTWTEPERLRSISRATSPDFKTWSDPVAMDPNEPGEHLYTNMTHPYYRAPHIYVATPTRFIPGRGDAPRYDAKDVNATDVLFMSTRAGAERYDRTFKEAFIRPGLEKSRWYNRANYVALNVVPTGAKEMSIYHRSGDRYVLRPDGFISLHAGFKTGEMTTKPLTFEGSALHVNAATSAAGDLRVEVQDADGKPLPRLALEDCAPLYGDDLDLVVRWKSDDALRAAAGKPVRLRFVMRECDLYSLKFE